MPLQFTFSLRIPQEYWNGLCDFSLWVPGPRIQPLPPQLLACMSQLSTTRLGGLPHRPHFFVGLPSSEESTATPPVRQALNSGVVWNTSSPPYSSSFHPAPRPTRMCCPNTVHQDNSNFPTCLPKSTCASSNDFSRTSQSQSTGNIQAGLEHASLTLGRYTGAQPRPPELCPPSPACLSGFSAPLCAQAGGSLWPEGQQALKSVQSHELCPPNSLVQVSPLQGGLWSWPGAGALVHPPALATFLSECVLSMLEITHVCVWLRDSHLSPLLSYKCHKNRNLPTSIHSPQNPQCWADCQAQTGGKLEYVEWINFVTKQHLSNLGVDISLWTCSCLPFAQPPHSCPSHLQVFLPDSSKNSRWRIHLLLTSQHYSSFAPSLPQNALIEGIQSLLIIRSKGGGAGGGSLSLSYWNSLLHLTVLITFSLKPFTTLVSMATHSPGWLSQVSSLSFSFSFVTYPHLDWYFKCHCTVGFCPGQNSLSLVILLILSVPVTWVVLALGQYSQQNFFLSPWSLTQVPAGLYLTMILTPWLYLRPLSCPSNSLPIFPGASPLSTQDTQESLSSLSLSS